MAKSTSVFFYKECGFETTKWVGQCPSCKAWSTMTEAPKKPAGIRGISSAVTGVRQGVTQKFSEISLKDHDRMDTGLKELNRVLGGGIVAGSLVLIGGDPGIGKSTILLQVCHNLSKSGKKVLSKRGIQGKINCYGKKLMIGESLWINDWNAFYPVCRSRRAM